MSEREEPFAEQDARVVKVDLERLKLIKINNFSGRTFIRGTKEAQIKVIINRSDIHAMPSIESKNEGREIEIAAIPGGGRLNINFNNDWRFGIDPDVAWRRPDDDFDAGFEPQRWNFSYDEMGHEEYQRQREEYHRQREQYRRQREEQRRQREQVREEYRRQREQAREASRRAKEQVREASRRGFFNNFDPSSWSEIARTIGQTVSNIVGALGDLYVEVPEGVELEVNNVSGMVEMSDIKGFCRVKNTSGGIKLNRITGGLQLKGLSGKMEAEELAGPVTAKVTSGHVSLRKCRMTALDLSVSSGHVQVETSLAEPDEGDYRISSSSGHIQVRLPKSSRASIECRTLSGRIITMPEVGPVEFKNRPGQSQSRIELNGGGRKVTVNAVSGNVELSLFDEGEGGVWPSAPQSWNVPTPPPPPPAPDFAPPPPPVPPSGPWMQGGFNPMPVTPPARPVPPEFVPRPAYQPPEQRPVIVTPPPPTVWPQAGEAEVKAAEAEAARVESVEAEAAEVEAVEKQEIPAEEAPKAEDVKKTRQLEILRAIERGEISVEDGMARLGELEDY